MRHLLQSVFMSCCLIFVVQPCGGGDQADQPESAPPVEQSLTGRVTQQEVLVKFKEAVPQDSIQSLATSQNLTHVRSLRGIGVQVYRVPAGKSVDDVLKTLQKNPNVEYAEPNQEYRIPEKQN